MDHHYLTKFLLILSILLRGCWGLGNLDEQCLRDGTCVPRKNLRCDANNFCSCLANTFPIKDKSYGACNAFGAKIGDLCVVRNPPCPPGLTCTENDTCGCAVDEYPMGNNRCIRRKGHEEPCQGDQCRSLLGLICTGGSCDCDKNGRYVWSPSQQMCVQNTVRGQDCSNVPCMTGTDWNLKCDLDSKKCVCDPPNLVDHPGGRCGIRAKLNENCGPPECEKDPGWNIKCEGGKCQCETGFIDAGGKRCDLPPKFGDKCPAPLICDPKGAMLCSANGICVCEPNKVEHQNKLCGNPGMYEEPCGPPICKVGSNLICDRDQKCACDKSKGDFAAYPDNTCGPKAKLDQKCGRPDCETGPTWNLQCVGGECACTDKNVPWSDEACGPGAKLGKTCDLPKCEPGGNMHCDPTNKTCVCDTGNVPHRQICGLPAKHGQECGPPICMDASNLTCSRLGRCACTDRWMISDPTGACIVRPLSTLNQDCELNEDCAPGLFLECSSTKRSCVCLKYYGQDKNKSDRCLRIPSGHSEFCSVDLDCIQDHKMVCNKVTQLCECEFSHELDANGATPCILNEFNGRTYEQTCEDKPVKRCVPSHNIACVRGICKCLDGHIKNEETLKDPLLKVITCKLGEGTQEYNQTCVDGSKAITDKCDSLKDIGCFNGICVCQPNYVPTGDPLSPCDGGRQPYGSTCDPPEVIVPPRGTDPRTGLPYPGPTSPPPPKIACDPANNLVCMNGKCGCKDEGVSGRSRLDSKSGKCLTTDGYACVQDSECFSGKCLDRQEAIIAAGGRASSHSHDERVCQGTVTTSGVLPGLSRVQLFPSTFFLTIHYFNFV